MEIVSRAYDNDQCQGTATRTITQAQFEAHFGSTCAPAGEGTMADHTCDLSGQPVVIIYSGEDCSGSPQSQHPLTGCTSNNDDDDDGGSDEIPPPASTLLLTPFPLPDVSPLLAAPSTLPPPLCHPAQSLCVLRHSV